MNIHDVVASEREEKRRREDAAIEAAETLSASAPPTDRSEGNAAAEGANSRVEIFTAKNLYDFLARPLTNISE